MGSKEGNVIARVLVDVSAKGWRMFRNTVGQAWAGKAEQVVGGGVMIKRPQRITYGLAVGSSDLVGWRTVRITPDMVGKTIAQFVAIECKTAAYPDTTLEQDNWLEAVSAAGGASYLACEDPDGIRMYEIDAP
jgi:hypothetical protein